MNRTQFLSLFAIPFLPKVDLPKKTTLIFRRGKKVGNYLQSFTDEYSYKDFGIFIPQGEGKFKVLKEGGKIEIVELKWKSEKFKSEVICKKV